MTNQGDADEYLARSAESLAGAELTYDHQQFQNCANRAYYACYQAAVAALLLARFNPRGERWGHNTVQALFAGELINRRKRYPPELRDTLNKLFLLRQAADYGTSKVSAVQAERAIRRARTFVNTIHAVERH
jgi:uncharacterized protein (UPF0332 family)